jgi:hypothetical protein
VFRLAARSAPRLLLGLAPIGTSPNSYFDGDLLTELALDGQPPRETLESFSLVAAHLKDSNRYGDIRIALPWAGLQLRAGDLDRAVEALQVDDSQVGTGDLVPARSLAAAAPPLALWEDQALAVPFAEKLAVAAAEARSGGTRGVLVRVGLLVAARLDAAGRAEDARRVRELLGAQAGLVPYAASWLQTPER